MFCDDEYLEVLEKSLEKVDRDVDIVVNDITGHEIPPELTKFTTFMQNDATMDPYIDVGDHDVAEILFTSGTTGKPKGVKISHINILIGSLNYSLGAPEMNSDVVFLNWLPTFHNGGQWSSLGTWLQGGTYILERGFDPESVAEAIEEYQVTHIWGHTTNYPPLLDYKEEYDLTSLKSANYAMAPMTMEVRKELFEDIGAKPWLGSGQTECFPATHYGYPEYQLEKEGNVWGVTAPLTKHALMDENGELIEETHKVGEIVTRGPNVMEGYLDPENEQGAWENGWLRWGDLGYFDEDGHLVFEDRKKDMIKSGGENVASVRVEDVLRSHPAIEDAAVIGISHPRWSEAVTGFVTVTEDVTADEIIEFCKESRLSNFEVPKEVVIMENFPKTETGKIQKSLLRAKYEDIYQ